MLAKAEGNVSAGTTDVSPAGTKVRIGKHRAGSGKQEAGGGMRDVDEIGYVIIGNVGSLSGRMVGSHLGRVVRSPLCGCCC